MNVYVTSAYSLGEQHGNIASAWVLESAQSDPYHIHTISDDPDSADIVLFVEGHSGNDTFYEKVVTHPLRRKYKSKTFLYHDSDYAFPLIPGVYPSIKRRYYNSAWCRSGVYLARLAENHAVTYDPDLNSNEFRFSFIGDNNCHVRSRILGLDYTNSYLKDTSGYHAWLLSTEDRRTYEQNYADVLRKSEFILCPRGIGPSTYRLYEAMEMGKCPVIISDDWVEPSFLPWNEFSIRIPESDYAKVPEILESRSGGGMGIRARKEWEKFVSKPVCFHWLVENCIEIMEERRNLPNSKTEARYFKLMQSEYFPDFYIRSKLRALKRDVLHPVN